MTEEEKELQNQETWDFSQSVVVQGAKPRAVVSVAFAREDHQVVVQAAKADGVNTSEFIRTAALSKARARTSVTTFAFAGMTLTGMIQTEGPSVVESTAVKTNTDIQAYVS